MTDGAFEATMTKYVKSAEGFPSQLHLWDPLPTQAAILRQNGSMSIHQTHWKALTRSRLLFRLWKTTCWKVWKFLQSLGF